MKTYSDEYQDVFILKYLGQTGFFLDIGCSDGLSNNNTKLLEENGWKGVGIDKSDDIEKCKKNRNFAHLFKIDACDSSLIRKSLKQAECPKLIDYISLDIDENSLVCLKSLPLQEYEFRIMTFEHDIYSNRKDCIERKQMAAPFLKNFGYELLIENIKCKSGPYEDWFAHHKEIQLINKFRNIKNKTGQEILNLYEQ